MRFESFCHILLKVPSRFRWVVEQTLREFFKAVQLGKDMDPSWKKQIYKVIARLDDYVPDYFKSQTFLDQLEWSKQILGQHFCKKMHPTYHHYFLTHFNHISRNLLSVKISQKNPKIYFSQGVFLKIDS